MKKLTVKHKKFRQINYLIFSVLKTLLSRNFCQKSVTVNFRNFQTVCCGKTKCVSVLTSKCPQYSVNTNFQDFNEIVTYAKKLKFPFHCTTYVCMYV